MVLTGMGGEEVKPDPDINHGKQQRDQKGYIICRNELTGEYKQVIYSGPVHTCDGERVSRTNQKLLQRLNYRRVK